MTLLLHDASNHNGLFDILGKAIAAIETLNTARGTTIPAATAAFGAPSPPLNIPPNAQAALLQVAPATATWQSNCATLTTALRQACATILVAFCRAEDSTLASDLLTCLQYLIDQMTAGTVTGGDHVAANAPTVTVTPNAGNAGDTAVVATLLDGTGALRQNVIPETIVVEPATASFSESIIVSSPSAITDMASQAWPGGSGLQYRVSVIDPANSLLTNGQFDVVPTNPNVPDGWMLRTGTAGTNVIVTTPATQQIVIGGTPTAGYFHLCWTNVNLRKRSTAAIPYTASASTIQTALRTIPGLEAVTVSSTGTSPNLTHTVTFTGVGGAVSQLTYINAMTDGTIAISTLTAADSASYRGQSLALIGDVSGTLTTLLQPLPVITGDMNYFLHFRARRGSIAAPDGAVTIAIMDGIDGSVVEDSRGNALSLEIAASSLGSSYSSHGLRIAIPKTADQPCFLQVAVTTALTDGGRIYLDDFALGAATELYAGGPFVAAFRGATSPASTDRWDITITNALDSKWQTWFHRLFDMNAKRLLLPTSGSGDLLADSLIS